MIKYRVGDAAVPVVDERPLVIAHVVNNVGRFGAGFSGAIARKYPGAKRVYKALWGGLEPGFGHVLIAREGDGVIIAHMMAQNGLRSPRNPQPLRYDWLTYCLAWLDGFCEDEEVGVVQMHWLGVGAVGI